MMLYPGEVGVCSEQMYAWAPPQQIPGTLYLTNLRLVFETVPQFPPTYGFEQALGLAPQGAPPMLNLEVRSITNVTAIPAPSGWHVLRVEANGGAYIYSFQTARAQEWVNSIQGVRGRSPLPTAASPPGAPGFPVTAAPTSASPPLSGGATPGTVWCTRCGKPNPSGAPQCASCGATLG